MKKKTFGGIMALLVMGIVVSAGAVSAFGGKLGGGAGEVPEELEAVHDALESGNYAAWVSAVDNLERKPVYADVITEDDFDTLVKMHNARETHRLQREAYRADVDEAIAAGDYEAWKEIVASMDNYPEHLETLTEEDFKVLVQIHQARDAGDFETMKELREDLDFPEMGLRGEGRGKMNGQGAGEGMGSQKGHRNGGFGQQNGFGYEAS